jgi:hypothetical protein
MKTSSRLVLLLPERRRFAGQAISKAVAALLGRADAMPQQVDGESAQLSRHFDLLPRGWPMAAITRQSDRGDASGPGWLRADPVFIRPEMMGARLMAWGNLGLSAEEAEAFLKPLRPIFGDAGFPISATEPERWYLQLPPDTRLPEFPLPIDALGGDLMAYLPEGKEAQRWRALANEAQIILHNHPGNQARVAAGLPPVNSLWFWGGGRLPDSTRCPYTSVLGAGEELLALAKLAGASLQASETGSVLVDLRRQRDWAEVERSHLLPGVGLFPHRFAALALDFADGSGLLLEASQRWRWFRRPLSQYFARVGVNG